MVLRQKTPRFVGNFLARAQTRTGRVSLTDLKTKSLSSSSDGMPQTQHTAGVLLWEFLGLDLIPKEQKQPGPQQVTAVSRKDVCHTRVPKDHRASAQMRLSTKPRDLTLQLWKHRKMMRALGQGTANLLTGEKGLKTEKAEQGRAVDSLFKERHLQPENRKERSHNDTCLVGSDTKTCQSLWKTNYK